MISRKVIVKALINWSKTRRSFFKTDFYFFTLDNKLKNKRKSKEVGDLFYRIVQSLKQPPDGGVATHLKMRESLVII